MKAGERIKELRLEHHMTQEELGNLLGVGKSAIAKYERGRVLNLKRSTIEQLSRIFNVSPSYVMGYTDLRLDQNEEKQSNLTPIASNLISVRPREIPILGTICAGNGIYAEENYQGSFALDKGISADYAIHVKGGSMTGAGIQDGDLAFIRKCDGDIVNGRIYAVILNGSNEATLKAVTAHEDFIVLTPLNPAYPVITTYSQEVYIAGELVGVYHPCL